MRREPDCDEIARELIRWGALGLGAPHAWDGAGISQPLVGGGRQLGRVLPGRGFYLDQDLKGLGITRGELPGVFQRSRFQRLRDFLGDDRAAITSYAQIVAQRQLGRGKLAVFPPRLTNGAHTQEWVSMIEDAVNAAYRPVYAAIPGGTAMDNTNPGSLGYQQIANPAGGNKKYITSVGMCCDSASATDGWGTAVLIDLLVAAQTIPISGTGAVTVNTAALPRYTSGAGVMLAFTLNVSDGTSAVDSSITPVYTNQAGVGSRTLNVGQTIGTVSGSTNIGRVMPLVSTAGGATPDLPPFCQLQAGDYGVQSLQTVTMGSAGTALSSMACYLYYPLLWLAGMATNRLHIDHDLYNTAACLLEWTSTGGGNLGCLNFLVQQPQNTNTGNVTGLVDTVEG